MWEFFDKVLGFLDMIWTLVVNTVESLIMIIGVIVNIPLTLASLSVFPAVIYTGVMITISFATIKFLVSR